MAHGIEGGRTGMVTALQRAGGALNVNLHFHSLVLDGVFTEAPGGAHRPGGNARSLNARTLRRVPDVAIRLSGVAA